METQFVQIREQQKEVWNRFSGGWKKWDDFTMNFMVPMGQAIIDGLHIGQSDVVLDVACGTGEPGLTIAKLATNGKVTGTDLAEKMLDIAKENAAAQKITNYETVVADVCSLPFQEASFDKISCRMGFMFFPDMALAASEMHRVLKPGGRLAASVWSGPANNLWITSILGIINKHMQLPQAPKDAPGMFRCAAPGYVKSILEEAGFTGVEEKEITGTVVFKDFETTWTMMNEVAAPVVAALSKADAEMKEKIKEELRQFAEEYTTDKGIAYSFGSLIISGSK